MFQFGITCFIVRITFVLITYEIDDNASGCWMEILHPIAAPCALITLHPAVQVPIVIRIRDRFYFVSSSIYKLLSVIFHPFLSLYFLMVFPFFFFSHITLSAFSCLFIPSEGLYLLSLDPFSTLFHLFPLFTSAPSILFSPYFLVFTIWSPSSLYLLRISLSLSLFVPTDLSILIA